MVQYGSNSLARGAPFAIIQSKIVLLCESSHIALRVFGVWLEVLPSAKDIEQISHVRELILKCVY